MRVFFAGSPQVAVPTLQALVKSRHTVVGVLTQPPRPQGRKKVLTATPVALAAEAAGVPVATPQDSEGILEAIQRRQPDVVFVVAYGRLLTRAELESVPGGWWNLHFSLLPRWRGAAPVPYAIAAGDATTGMSIFQIETRMDTGPVATTVSYPIAPHDTTNTVLTKLSELAPTHVLSLLDDLERGAVQVSAQSGEVSFAPIPPRSVGEMSWNSPVAELYNRFRAWHEEPGCYSFRSDTDQRVNIIEAWPDHERAGLEPGQILPADEGVAVGTGTTALMLGRVQPSGRGAMSATDWLRGLPSEWDFVPKGVSARDIAFEVALAVENDGAFANLALPRALAGSSLDTRDKAFATHLVYGALRAQGELDAVIEEATQRSAHSLDSDVRVLLRLGCFQLLRMRVEPHAAVDETVRLAKSRQLHRVTGLVNAALRAVSAHSGEYWDRVIGQSTTSLHSHPSWIAAKIDAALAQSDGDGELEQALTSHNEAPRVTLCHLPGFSSPDNEYATAFSPCGEVLEGGDPTVLPGVARHHVRVQDQGSQLAALAISRVAPWGEGERVWDMCAGPGGKTALLGAEACASGATVLATELSAHRASLVEDSITAVSSRFPGGIRVEIDDSTKSREEKFSRILLDAPCSGLGALRRRPEARWTKKPESLLGLVELQRALLRNGLRTLAPGGFLAYVTCSPVVEETTEVVANVLEESEGFSALDTPTIMGSVAKTTMEGHRRGSAAQLWTHRHGTDAMFVQIIRREH